MPHFHGPWRPSSALQPPLVFSTQSHALWIWSLQPPEPLLIVLCARQGFPPLHPLHSTQVFRKLPPLFQESTPSSTLLQASSEFKTKSFLSPVVSACLMSVPPSSFLPPLPPPLLPFLPPSSSSFYSLSLSFSSFLPTLPFSFSLPPSLLSSLPSFPPATLSATKCY